MSTHSRHYMSIDDTKALLLNLLSSSFCMTINMERKEIETHENFEINSEWFNKAPKIDIDIINGFFSAKFLILHAHNLRERHKTNCLFALGMACFRSKSFWMETRLMNHELMIQVSSRLIYFSRFYGFISFSISLFSIGDFTISCTMSGKKFVKLRDIRSIKIS